MLEPLASLEAVTREKAYLPMSVRRALLMLKPLIRVIPHLDRLSGQNVAGLSRCYLADARLGTLRRAAVMQRPALRQAAKALSLLIYHTDVGH